ncbi:MAG TPA: hypothetical protein VJN42_05485 [Candidatus Acidoferrum sp.]|nr:hypothetical protein [Candidatus Acidoferrum sp.]
MTGPRHADRPTHSEATPPNPDSLEVAPGRQRETIEGWIPEMASEGELREALEKAFDYRGDVTLTTKDGRKIEGYVFDRITGPALSTSFVRLMPSNSTERLKIAYADIKTLAFSGRDTAAGKSWEAWVRKYWEKKTAGQSGLSLQAESLD